MSLEWRSDKPPNEQWVEVKKGRHALKARAIWGRDGTLPHWEDCKWTCYPVSAFAQWRPFPADEGKMCAPMEDWRGANEDWRKR